MKTTRLDTVHRIKEDAELSARRRLSVAVGQLEAARSEVEAAAEELARQPLASGQAWLVDAFDRAHDRSVQKLRVAQEALEAAAQATEQARAVHTYAHRAARVIGRVVEERRGQMVRETLRREQQVLDELALRA